MSCAHLVTKTYKVLIFILILFIDIYSQSQCTQIDTNYDKGLNENKKIFED